MASGDSALVTPVGDVSGPTSGLRRRAAALAILLGLSSMGVATAPEISRRLMEVHYPVASPAPITPLFATPPARAVTVHGLADAVWATDASAIVRDDTLWQRMRFPDWDALPVAERDAGLEALLRSYSAVIALPGSWDRMRAEDWDRIPQPVRSVAFRRMVAYWCGFYGVGRDYGLAPTLVSDTVAAIIMSESWLDHRAVNLRDDGSDDLGLAQASPFARQRMEELHGAGLVDVHLNREDYFNPWRATRFAAIWMNLLLGEADGNLDLAVRAYHRGISRARDARGTWYVDMVYSRRSRYIWNQSAPSAWDQVWRRARVLFGPT